MLLRVPRALDAVFLDEDLGPGSCLGTDIARQVREHEAHAGLPRVAIVGVTASADCAGHEALAKEAGQDLVFGKPLSHDARPMLLDLIARTTSKD